MTTPTDAQAARAGRILVAGLLLGLGTVAFVDETVFHQLLHWHHFYDRSTTDVGLVSDGLFHAFSWFATVASLFLVADLRRERSFWPRRFVAGWLAGAGFFQLYDGLVQHKLLGLHQIRYGVDLAPYDAVWNVVAAGLLVAGLALIAATTRAARQGGVIHHAVGVGPDLIGTEMLVVALLAAAVAYLVAARRTPWPAARLARWSAGIAVAVVGLVVSAGPHDLRVHVAGHLLLGMVAPLLLATAAPVTLALRALPRPRARALGQLLRSSPFALVSHPAVAALLDTGGMWLLFRTDLLAAVPPVLVNAHMLAAGYLFAFSLVGGDPAPHRPALGHARCGARGRRRRSRRPGEAGLRRTRGRGRGLPACSSTTAARPCTSSCSCCSGREWAAGQRRTRRRAARRRVAARSSGTSPP